MVQWYKHLFAATLLGPNVVFDGGVASIKPALIAQPFKYALGCVALLTGTTLIFGQPMIYLFRVRIQLRTLNRNRPSITGRLRIRQHLRNTIPADTKIPGNLTPTQPALKMSAPYLQIQIHGKYPHALPNFERAKMDDFYAARDTTMTPLPWPSIAPPITHLTCPPENVLVCA
jgi:hypothetical protein